jgi:hypothetical protein
MTICLNGEIAKNVTSPSQPAHNGWRQMIKAVFGEGVLFNLLYILSSLIKYNNNFIVRKILFTFAKKTNA